MSKAALEPAPVVRSGREMRLYRILHRIAVPIFWAGFRLDLSGREHVPRTGPVILASVHRSYLDIPMAGMITWRPVHYMAKAELWERRFSGWFCESMGGIPVKRGAADRAALDACVRVLEMGDPLCLFPEGTRQTGPVVQDCHGGVAWLAQRTGAPVVPMAITGTDKAMGLGMSRPHLAKIRVLAGHPLELTVPGARPGSRGARETATGWLRAEIQRLYDGLRAVAASD